MIHENSNVSYPFPSLNLMGNTSDPNDFYLGKPVASMSVRGVATEFFADTPDEFTELEKLFRERQKEVRGEPDCRWMQPHIVQLRKK